MRSAFFTCATLSPSFFGDADVGAADVTGADLRGARMAGVQNLTSEQLVGATVGPDTELPPGVSPPTRVAWGTTSTRCRELVNTMTDLRAGAGDVERFPCGGEPLAAGSEPDMDLDLREDAALRRTCAAGSDAP